MKKILATMMLVAATAAMAVVPGRVGPVSTYGALKANGSKLSGTCPQYSNSKVQVKGMSLFWSSAADSALVYYTSQAMGLMVKDMGIEVLRFALGVADEKFDSHKRSYTTGGANDQKAMVKKMVYAAVENDIYIILDWHIESAQGYTNEAKEFFEWAAKEFGKTHNVIFEVWNEPNGAQMSTVASHANQVIPIIRKYSDNLILVGSPEWSSHPEQCATAGIQDSKKNFACTLHFYAASHSASGDYPKRAKDAMDAGIPVFASEWGTVNASGDGDPNQGESQSWVNWMNQNGVSWANWSASAINEKSAAFTTLTLNQGLKYSTSGSMVKGFLAGSHSYKDCGLGNSLGSSSAESGFSQGVANGATTNIIDDLEDGDRYTYTGGFWSAWADSDEKGSDGTGSTKISNKKWTNDFDKEVYDVVVPAKGGNESKYMAALEGIYIDQGGYKWAPYVAMGLNFKKDTSEFAQLANCSTISYKYKGAAHNFRIEISPITNYNFHYAEAEASGEWKTVELTMDMFQQHTTWANPQIMDLSANLGKAKRLAWEVNGVVDRPASEIQPLYDYLYVDDVRCDGVSITAISGTATTSSSSVNSSSSTTSSSSVTNPTSSSSSVTVPPVSSTVVITDLLVIDDVEDGDEVLNTTGTWYAYTDKDPGGLSSITNVYDPALPGYVVVFPGSTDPTNGTQGFVGLQGIVWNQAEYGEAPFVALGLNMMADTSVGFDMSACKGISYRYKGSRHTFKIQDGQVQDYAYHQRKLLDSADWKTVVITWDELGQPSWGEQIELNKASIKKMAWEVIGYKNSDLQPDLNYLYVDDLKCVDQVIGIKSIARAATGLNLAARGHDLSIMTSKSGLVKVQVFDMTGHTVKSLSENMQAGAHMVSLENLTAGSYIVRVQAGKATKSARITLK